MSDPSTFARFTFFFFFFCFVYCSHMSMLAATMSHVLVSSASPLLHLQACNAKRHIGCAKRPTEPKPFSSFLTCSAAMYPDSFHRKLRLEERRCSGEFGLCLAIGTSVCYVRFSARLTRSGYFSWLWKFAHNSRVCFLCASMCVCSLSSDDKWWTPGKENEVQPLLSVRASVIEYHRS